MTDDPLGRWGFSPEMRFVLDGLAARHGGPPPSFMADLDWARVLRLVRHHRVAPLMDQVLTQDDAIPGALRDGLIRQQRQAAKRTLAQAGEVIRLTKAFRAAGITVLTLKGVALSVQLYNEPGRRAGNDIDLLVPSAQMPEATRILRDLGYSEDVSGPVMSHKDIALHHPTLGIVVELHDALDECVGAFPIAEFRPFETAVAVPVGDESVLTLAPAQALVFAAFHGAHHFWRRLLWLTDIAAACHSQTVNWPDAFALARRMGVEPHLALAVALAHDLLGAPLPPPLQRSSRKLEAARRAGQSLRPLLIGPPLESEAVGILAMGRFRWLSWELRLFNGNGNRWALLRYRLQPSEIDRRQIALPRFLGFLYYLIRLQRILADTIRH